MSNPPKWTIEFEYDDIYDVVLARFRGVVLSSAEDVLRWRRAVEQQFERFRKPVDLLIDLEGLVVQPSAASPFGEHRSRVLAHYTTSSFRFNGDAATRFSVLTSATTHGAAANVFNSREEAMAALLQIVESSASAAVSELTGFERGKR